MSDNEEKLGSAKEDEIRSEAADTLHICTRNVVDSDVTANSDVADSGITQEVCTDEVLPQPLTVGTSNEEEHSTDIVLKESHLEAGSEPLLVPEHKVNDTSRKSEMESETTEAMSPPSNPEIPKCELESFDKPNNSWNDLEVCKETAAVDDSLDKVCLKNDSELNIKQEVSIEETRPEERIDDSEKVSLITASENSLSRECDGVKTEQESSQMTQTPFETAEEREDQTVIQKIVHQSRECFEISKSETASGTPKIPVASESKNEASSETNSSANESSNIEKFSEPNHQLEPSKEVVDSSNDAHPRTGTDSNSIKPPKTDTSEVNNVKNSPNQPGTSKKGFSQLEQMSHEDLLKQCKRQLLFLQKTKMKHDELSVKLQDLLSENRILKETSNKTGVSADLLRSLQSENDRLLDEKESQAAVITLLNKDVERLVNDLTTTKEHVEEHKRKFNQVKDLLTSTDAEKKRQDALILDLQSQIIVIRSERDSMNSEAKLRETKFVSLEEELKNRNLQAATLQSSLEQLKQELEKKKLLNLEIGDYERSLSDLNTQLAERSRMVDELNMQLMKNKEDQDALNQQIELLEQQCLNEEGRSAHLKETLSSTRDILASKCEELADLASALHELKQQKEDILASKEELQCQLCESSSHLMILENELKQSREQNEKQDHSLKTRISTLSEELGEARQQLETSRQDFLNYKVRVHSVLKQQKTTGSNSGKPVSAQDEDQKGEMEWTLELCKGKISQMTEQLDALTLERDSLRKEQDWLLSKQNLLSQQMQEKEELLLQRLEESRQQLDMSRSLWETEKQQLLQKQQSLTSDFERRFSSQEREHEKHVSSLVDQMEQMLKSAPVLSPLVVEQNPARHQNHPYDFLPGTQLSPSVDESFDICSQERQEGEGSECTDMLPAPAAFQTLVTTPASGFIPLERLLQADTSPSFCNQDPEMVAINMNTLQKKVDHISELLNESEASNLRLSEQTRLLKEEIRRLERNKERQQHSANLEYLKNIVLKFNTLPSGSERERLVPVLTTVLRLSPEEHAEMAKVACQGDPSGPNSASWGSYLHRWSGLQ